MDETLAAAIRLLHTELDALRIVQAHPELPAPPHQAVLLVADAVEQLEQAQRLLDT